MINQKIHTGCSCKQCKRGKTKKVRSLFHRLLRRLHRKELREKGEIITVNKSLGYTD